MLAQVQVRDKAYVGDQSATAKSRELIQNQSFENLHRYMDEASPSQRIDVLIYLWGGDDTDEMKSAKNLIDQYVTSSTTGDQGSKASVSFSLALTITAEFSHYLDLDFDRHRSLNSILSSFDDYESMGAQVRSLFEPLQPLSLQPDTAPESADHGMSPRLSGPALNFPGRIHADTPQMAPLDRRAEVERSATPGRTTEKSSPRSNKNKKPSREQFAVRSFEAAGSSIVKKIKAKLASAFDGVREGFYSARESVSKFARRAAQSIRESFTSLKHAIQRRSQQFSESLLDAGVSTAEQFQGKTFARIKSSVSRATKRLVSAGKRVLKGGREFSESTRNASIEAREAFRGKTLARVKSSVSRATERVVGGGKRVLRVAASAGKLVAHGVARGVKAAVSFFDKAVDFVGNRIVALRGFNRV